MPINAKARLADKEGLTSSIVLYRFEMIEPLEFNFIPGQYIELDIGENQKRKYSLCSSPLNSNKSFDIVVDLFPQGPGSKYLESLEMNQEVTFVGELGEFILPEIISPNLFFIASSTGIAPLRAMIDSILANREDYDVDIFVYHEGRTIDQVIWQDVFNSYLKDKHIDDYHVYITDGATEENGSEKGDATLFMNRIDKGKIADSQFFLCGSGEMIQKISDGLKNLSASSDSIIYEKHY